MTPTGTMISSIGVQVEVADEGALSGPAHAMNAMHPACFTRLIRW